MRRTAAVLFSALFVIAVGCSQDDKPKTATPPTTPVRTTPATPVEPPKPAVSETAEVEPNNKADQATELTIETKGKGFINGEKKEVKGKEVQATDVDYWKFTIADGPKDVKLAVSGLESIDLALYLYSEKDTREALVKAYSNTNGKDKKRAKLGEVIPSIILQNGTYIVRVGEFKRRRRDADHHDAENPYFLSISTSDVKSDFEAEPNDRRVDASNLAIDEEKKGYMSKSKDLDWYKLELPQLPGPKLLRVELNGPADIRPSVSIRNEIEATLKEVSAQKDGDKVVLPNFFVEDATQPLYVVVNPRWDHNTEATYSIKATLVDIEGESEREANDRPVEATAMEKKERIRGYIDQGKRLDQAPWRKQDEDWYKLSFDKRQQFSLTLSGLPEVDLILAVYDSEGQNKVIEIDDKGKKEGEIVPRMIMKEALIKVSAKRSHYNYDHPYELVVKTYPDDNHTEIEPNNDDKGAQEIKVGDKTGLRGWIHPKTDVDVYRLDLSSAEEKSYHVQVSGIPLVRLGLTIVDQEGKEIAKEIKKQDKVGAELTAQLAPGVYFIKVADGRKRHSNPLNDYTIKVSEK